MGQNAAISIKINDVFIEVKMGEKMEMILIVRALINCILKNQCTHILGYEKTLYQIIVKK